MFGGVGKLIETAQGNQRDEIKIVLLLIFQSIFTETHDRNFPLWDI